MGILKQGCIRARSFGILDGLDRHGNATARPVIGSRADFRRLGDLEWARIG